MPKVRLPKRLPNWQRAQGRQRVVLGSLPNFDRLFIWKRRQIIYFARIGHDWLFGMTDALCQGMQTLIEHTGCETRPFRTREEAAELLEALRAAYQSLPSGGRSLVKSAISKVAQFTIEID
jgi:hypothetical protein